MMNDEVKPAKPIPVEFAAAVPVAEFEHSGRQFVAHRGEDVPILTAALIAECERRNNSNPDLVRLNHNTWAKKEAF